MPALDTLVLVRYLVQDDDVQLASARRLFAQCITEDQTLFVPVTVAVEPEWVLRANYGRAKDRVFEVLSRLFSAVELTSRPGRRSKWRCSFTAPVRPT